MNKLYWSENALPVKDSEAVEIALNLQNRNVITCNSTVVTAARMLVATGEMELFVFVHDGNEYPVNKYGVLSEYTYPQVETDLAFTILKAATKTRKELQVARDLQGLYRNAPYVVESYDMGILDFDDAK